MDICLTVRIILFKIEPRFTVIIVAIIWFMLTLYAATNLTLAKQHTPQEERASPPT